MKLGDRRSAIANLLISSKTAVSGSRLGEMFGVTRQIIVGDINFLKSVGYDIIATNKGYILKSSPRKERVFKLYHTAEQTEDELSTIVKLGGTVADVFVWHKIYGKVSANLNISSEAAVKDFIEGVRSGKSSELMNITGGYHYHTVRADSEAELDNIEAALKAKDFIAPEI